MTTFFAFMLLIAVGAETADDKNKQTPNDAVATMNTVLAEKDFEGFYDTHCHKHLRDQLGRAQFVEYMKSDRGAAIVRLFADVRAAIKEKKGEDVLIARSQEKLDAAEAASRVGYESPSQFSREYRRMFGAPPRQDVAALAAVARPTGQSGA